MLLFFFLLFQDPTQAMVCEPVTHVVPVEFGSTYCVFEVDVTACGAVASIQPITSKQGFPQQVLMPGLQLVQFAGLTPSTYEFCVQHFCDPPCDVSNLGPSNCITIDLSNCIPPTNYGLVNKTATTITVDAIYPDCGGKFEIFDDLMNPPLLSQSVPDGHQQITFSNLMPDTDYIVCYTNRCRPAGIPDCTTFISAPPVCQILRTEALTTCDAPASYSLQARSPNSITVQSNFGPYGGRVQAKIGTSVIAQAIAQPGTQSVLLGGLAGGTTYSVCFQNACDFGLNFYSPTLCASITTEVECRVIEDIALKTLTPFTFEAEATFGDFGGSAKLYKVDGSFTETFYSKGFQKIRNPYQLEPNTTYILCVRNACNVNQTQFTEENCISINTPPEMCVPPPSLMVTDITSNSMRLVATAGPFGAQVTMVSGSKSRSREMAANSTEKEVNFLPDATTFRIEIRNHCYNGGLSDPITATATTLSAEESNGYLSPPTFVTEQLIWAEKGRVRLVLPNPNSDGWDRFGNADLAYQVRMTLKDCDADPLYDGIVTSNKWPKLLVIPVPIPATEYEVQVRRTLANSKGGGTSKGTVLVGPSNDNTTQISTTLTDVKRWLLHVPRKSGGFEGTLVLNNRFPDLPAVIWVAGYDANGQYVPGSTTSLLVVGSRAEIPIYPVSGSSISLYSGSMTDLVSHIGLFEEYNRHTLETAVTYRKSGDPEGLTATVQESDFSKGDPIGAFFTIEGRTAPDFWDGVAVLNLAGNSTTEVIVKQRHNGDDSVLAEMSLGNVLPGQKRLSVLSDQFPLCTDCYYTLEAKDPKKTFQVLGLRGTLTTESSVLVESKSFKKY
ncbi:MAG: hypothetical protein H6510_06395 [Acidobacteria bacterium]|nr:hypothetical protein [Acidobacteriota bacterium]MCB9397425.1 hypothetical protein [Acidobacteriota bacterium]